MPVRVSRISAATAAPEFCRAAVSQAGARQAAGCTLTLQTIFSARIFGIAPLMLTKAGRQAGRQTGDKRCKRQRQAGSQPARSAEE